MKSCNEISDMITLYIDDKLDSRERIELEEHISRCASCKQEFEDTLEIVNLCREIPEVDLPENFKAELHEKLVQEKENAYGNRKTTLLRRKYVKICATIAAGLLLVFVMKAFLGNMLFKLPQGLKGSMSAKNDVAMDSAAPEMLEADVAKEESKEDEGFNGKSEKMKKSMTIEGAGEKSEAKAFQAESQCADEAPEKYTASIRNTAESIVKVEDTKLTITLSGNVEEFYSRVESIKRIAVQNGAEFPEGIYGKTEKLPEDEVKEAISRFSFSLPDTCYQSFVNQLISEVGPANIKVFKLSNEEVVNIRNEMSKTLEELNDSIKEMENSSDISNPEEIEYMRTKREYLKNEIDKSKENSGFTFVLVEVSQ